VSQPASAGGSLLFATAYISCRRSDRVDDISSIILLRRNHRGCGRLRERSLVAILSSCGGKRLRFCSGEKNKRGRGGSLRVALALALPHIQ
jgi:hypothetical protein